MRLSPSQMKVCEVARLAAQLNARLVGRARGVELEPLPVGNSPRPGASGAQTRFWKRS